MTCACINSHLELISIFHIWVAEYENQIQTNLTIDSYSCHILAWFDRISSMYFHVCTKTLLHIPIHWNCITPSQTKESVTSYLFGIPLEASYILSSPFHLKIELHGSCQWTFVQWAFLCVWNSCMMKTNFWCFIFRPMQCAAAVFMVWSPLFVKFRHW